MDLAAENFLIPNGTFFVVLLIFIIVLVVLGKFIVPPIRQVLEEREALVSKTNEDNKAAAKSFEDAESEYRSAMKGARVEATGIRDEARAKGNENLEEMRRRATEESDAVQRETSEQLAAEGQRAAAEARAELGRLSSGLASRVLGFDVSSDPKLSASLDRVSATEGEKTGTVN
ncbi:F0F1 ATP synthase subunit B [Williamsia muralis]|uniref:ATP synthase subunit b n=1 Tax=Williamsia marianensis TaxID=85044 RepID=A0A2G3PNB6_WILMA|nr:MULTISPECIES: F0F1 ATP synthase subunit B [Williamsia]PHV67261.1 F0F1 ATP synthase subunit B [Williamsia marianensis]PVY31202.1 F-type H+-transporting ATPase subunit b [Williamsia marianensis]PZT88252.1 MAG: F0F1 ATP synthase subunit B [Gordonia sp. (in: high G+C Gram-positive bacteria)]RKR95988.1 F-type H+-transporting ATPase subunit b [Williamsia muralis]